MVVTTSPMSKTIEGLTDRCPFIVTKNREYVTVAIRIRTGDEGYSEWMNELQVYLLPNFKHSNILEYLKSDMHLPSTTVSTDYPEIRRERMKKYGSFPKRRLNTGVEYWLINRYEGCRTLRQYLRLNTLSWQQLIYIARGIASGINYLHENADYQNFNQEKMIDGFVRSTNGAISKAAFLNPKTTIRMQPHVTLSIIHRNLSSENIVLKPDLTPCIWNFSTAYVHHPFQPTNCNYIVGPEVNKIHMTSQYSAPEVLQHSGHLTLASMKSIDMYACGILYWELISRTVLPRLNIAQPEEHRQRAEPHDYREPFEEELKAIEGYPEGRKVEDFLQYAVGTLQVRPQIRLCWTLGKKSRMFVQTFQDLWDVDFDARLHSSTVLDRLERISLSDKDARCSHKHQKESNYFKLYNMWPPTIKCLFVPETPEECGQPNIIFHMISDDAKGCRSSRSSYTSPSSRQNQDCPLVAESQPAVEQSLTKEPSSKVPRGEKNSFEMTALASKSPPKRVRVILPKEGPSKPVARPYEPVPGPSRQVTSPSEPMPGHPKPVPAPFKPKPHPSEPVAGPSSQVPSPSEPVPGPSRQVVVPYEPVPGPSRQVTVLYKPVPNPSKPVFRPYGPVPGPSSQVPSPSEPMPGPSKPVPGPSKPKPQPSGPVPGPSRQVTGPSEPMPGPSKPVPGPSKPVPDPSGLSFPKR